MRNKKAEKIFTRNLFVNISLAVGSVLALLLIIEIALRVIASLDHNYLDNLVSQEQLTNPENNHLGSIVRLNQDNKIVFELRPNLKGVFAGQKFSINSLGMRDKERNSVKPANTFRILALGDSHTFGWGVPQGDTWPAVLEDMLEKSDVSRNYEVMNMAVPGYNTVQEVEVFLEKGRKYAPDMVIINYIDNDMDLPNFLASPPAPYTLSRSSLKDFVHRRLEILEGNVLNPMGLVTIPMDDKTKRFRLPMERIPERFRPLYGYKNMVNAFGKLAEACREMGIPYVLLINFDDYRHRLRGRTPTVILPAARKPLHRVVEQGYLMVNPEDRIFNYLKENNLDFKAVWVSDADPHSNSIRHRFLAEELFEQLKKTDLI